MPHDKIKIDMPAPYGAAIVAGIMPAVPMSFTTRFRGIVEVYQHMDGDYRTGNHVLTNVCKFINPKKNLYLDFSILATSFYVGLLGTVELRDIKLKSKFPYESHHNLGGYAKDHSYMWIFKNPAFKAELGGPADPPPQKPAQQTLF